MYTANDIRNIALLGHGGDGKTMLAEDMLYLTHGSDRLGSIVDGNTVSDFDPEEIKGMRNAVQELMQFCVSDEDVLACLDTNTCHYAMELTKILNKSVEAERR